MCSSVYGHTPIPILMYGLRVMLLLFQCLQTCHFVAFIVLPYHTHIQSFSFITCPISQLGAQISPYYNVLPGAIYCCFNKNLRGEGGVGFLVRECVVDEVEFISQVRYEESVWMKVRGGRGREALYIGCVYMPTDSNSVSVMDSVYEQLKEDVLSFKQKGRVVLLGDFNARVGNSVDVDDVIGMFGEDFCNGNRC